MNENSNTLIVFLMLIALMACTNKYEKAIHKYELHQNQIRITRFIEIEATKPFIAKDSADILSKEYEIALSNKLVELSQTKAERVKVKKAAQESLASTANKQMEKIIKNRLKLIESEIEYANRLIDTYKNYPEQTFLNNISQAIDKYNSNPNSILGHTQQATFIGKEGLLAEKKFTKTYYLSTTNKAILRTIQ